MDIHEISSRAAVMADKVFEAVVEIDAGFMKNRPEPLEKAMACEDEINSLEESVTRDLLDLSKTLTHAKDRAALVALEGTVEMLERMGDEAMNLIERIEIKVDENLMFSDRGVEQFKETYDTMRESVDMMRQFLKTKDASLKGRIVDNGFHVKELVERYRKEHTERLINGLCSPIAANMYFDMLDFTGNLARHASNIVKLY